MSTLYQYNVCVFERKNTAWAMHVTAVLSSNMHKMNTHMLKGNVAKFYRKAKRTNNTKLRCKNDGDPSISQGRATLV